MNNRDQLLNDDDGEETMVAPRFDDEETVLARPVVPLEEVGDAPAARAASPSGDAPAPLYSRLRGAPRRSLVAGLVLVSALAGSVLGVGGLYLYQKHRAADANAAQQQQAEAPAAQPTVQTATESRQQEASAPAQVSTPAPAAPEPDAQASEDSDSSKETEREEARDDAAAERRNASGDTDSARAVKRGKKGERDEDIQRGANRAPRYDDDDRPVARDDDDTREARRVGVITYRPRRVRQRRDRYDTPDRLRRIFEGQP